MLYKKTHIFKLSIQCLLILYISTSVSFKSYWPMMNLTPLIKHHYQSSHQRIWSFYINIIRIIQLLLKHTTRLALSVLKVNLKYCAKVFSHMLSSSAIWMLFKQKSQILCNITDHFLSDFYLQSLSQTYFGKWNKIFEADIFLKKINAL